MGLFVILKGIIDRIHRIRRAFLWSGFDLRCKLAQVSWDVVCRPRRFYGLRVDSSSLWRAVLVAKYGKVALGWRINVVGLRSMSPVWRRIVTTVVSPELGLFLDIINYVWKVASGTKVLFWLDPWCSEVPLKEVFPRLFSLAHNNFAWVADYSWKGTFVHELWESNFRRQLRFFEINSLWELRAVVLPVQLRVNDDYRLVWKSIVTGQFSAANVRVSSPKRDCARRGTRGCVRCEVVDEAGKYLLFLCPFAKRVDPQGIDVSDIASR
ncbi:hypothetical protein GQ457_01G010970 [Hibiscus cannabinus]